MMDLMFNIDMSARYVIYWAFIGLTLVCSSYISGATQE